MRVLHVAPPPGAPTGIAAYAARFRSALQATGVDVVALSPAPGRRDAPSTVRSTAREVVRLAGQCDIVHLELGGGSLPEYYAARAVADRTSCPLVLTVHDPPRLVWSPFHIAPIHDYRGLRIGAGVLLAALARTHERQTARGASRLFTLSRTGAERLQMFVRSRAVIEALPYPIDAASAGDVVVADRVPLVIGYFGYWYRGKGIGQLLEALGELRDRGRPVQLRMWSSATSATARRESDRVQHWVLGLIDRLGLSESVHLMGTIPESQIAAQLRTCHAIVLPYEVPRAYSGLASTSAAAHDAIAAGVPVISTGVRALTEVVMHERNGLIVADPRPATLRAAIERLLDEPGLVAALREGAAMSASGFSLHACGTAAGAAYEELAGA